MVLIVAQRHHRIHARRSECRAQRRRLPGARTVQRTVFYLGEIKRQQQGAWRKTLEVFDEDGQNYRTMCLFPDDGECPLKLLDSIR